MSPTASLAEFSFAGKSDVEDQQAAKPLQSWSARLHSYWDAVLLNAGVPTGVTLTKHACVDAFTWKTPDNEGTLLSRLMQCQGVATTGHGPAPARVWKLHWLGEALNAIANFVALAHLTADNQDFSCISYSTD